MRFISLSLTLAFAGSAAASAPAPITPETAQLSTGEDSDTTIVFEGTSPSSEALSFQIVSQPDFGVIVEQSGLSIYRPPANFNGQARFSYVAFDGSNTSEETWVTVTVRPGQDAVSANSQDLEVDEDGRVQFQLTAEAESGVGVGWEILEGPANGTLLATGIWVNSTPVLTYEPNANFFGSDRIVVAAYDRGSPDASVLEIPIFVEGSADEPGVVYSVFPEPNEEVSTLRPIFQWTTTTDPDGDPITYQVRVWDAVTNADVASASGIRSTRTYAQWRLETELEHGRSYGWEVYASDASASGAIADGGVFEVSSNNAAPAGLALVLPTEGSHLTTDTPTIQFETAVDPEGGAVWHEVEVDTTQNFADPNRFRVVLPTYGGTEYVELSEYNAGLPRYERAFARVRAVDASGATSEWHSVGFTTGGPNSAPTAPVVDVVSGAEGDPCVWSISSTDPDADAVQYEITKIVGGEGVFTSFYDVGAPGAAYRCTMDDDGRVISLWVRAIDEFGAASEWSWADARRADKEVLSASCSVLPGTAGLLPLGLVLVGLRRRRR